METYNRPLTPPDNDRLKDSTLPEVASLQKKQDQVFPPVTGATADITSTQPITKNSTTTTTTTNHSASNPFTSETADARRTSQPPPGYQHGVAFPFEKGTSSSPVTSAATSAASPTNNTAKYGSSQRNDTTHRIETEALNILQWKNPLRSGAIMAMIVGSIILSRWYSLLQLGSMALTLAIGINLIYVHFMLQSQKVLTSTDNVSHPYRDVIDNERSTAIDRQSVRRYTNMFIEVAETVIRALTRIVFIDDTKTSIKWLAISFTIWKISAHMSTVNIILFVTLSAFTFPRLYISNKDVVDSHLHKGQTLIQNSLNKAQEVAKEGINDTYAKARAMTAKAGTTGTDAKNTLNNSSVTVKQD